MPRSRLVLALVAAAAASALIAPSADAEVVFKEHFEFTDSHIEQDVDDEFCPNVEFLVLHEVEGVGHTLVKTKGRSSFPYFAETHRFNEHFTNLENGKSLQFLTASRNGDQKIVDNGDGTITITIQNSGRQRIIGPDGKMLFLDAGQFRFEAVIDYSGTPENPEDDEEISFELIRQVGHSGTEGRDFCEDLVTFLG